MDLNKILIACDARAFSIALGEYMESKASKSIEFANKLIDAESVIHDYFELYIQGVDQPSASGWQSFVYSNNEDIMRDVSGILGGEGELQKHYFTSASNSTKPLVNFFTNTLGEQWHEYVYGAASDTDHFKSLAARFMNSAYACLAEGAAYRTLGLNEKVDIPVMITTFDTILKSNLNASDSIVNNLRSYIITKFQNCNNIVDYVMQTQAAESFDTLPNNSLAYQYTGTHPIMSFTIDCSSVLSAVVTSWGWVKNFYTGLFKTFISVGKKVINLVYNFFSSLTVDPACVSFNNNGSAYTMDQFFAETETVISGDMYSSLVAELEKGPISINLVTSENILYLDTNSQGNKVIRRRTKQKLVGDLSPVFNAAFSGHGNTYTDSEIMAFIDKAIPCIDPASVSSSTGRLMLQSFYQSTFLEFFIHRYLAKCYNQTLTAAYPWSWDQFKDYFLGTANTGSNEKYYKMAAEGELYNVTISNYVLSPTALSWVDVMYPLINTILSEQNTSSSELEGAFFPYSHSVVNFRSSKIVILTDAQIADAWTTRLVTTVAVVVAAAVLCKTVTKYKKAVRDTGLEKEAYWYQMQSEIQSTGHYNADTMRRFKSASRKSTVLGLVGGGLASAGNATLNSMQESQGDLKTIISLINPAALK